jgi:hypothetical protein
VNTETSSNDGKYYTDTEIAGLLGISHGRLRNKLCAGSPLSPHIQPPGCRSRLWPCRAGAIAWIMSSCGTNVT